MFCFTQGDKLFNTGYKSVIESYSKLFDNNLSILLIINFGGPRGRDRKVVGFTTTCVISTYQHWSYEFKPRSWRGVLDTTLCDKVCHWLTTGWCFSLCTVVSSTNKTDWYNWNIVENGFKHNNPEPINFVSFFFVYY